MYRVDKWSSKTIIKWPERIFQVSPSNGWTWTRKLCLYHSDILYTSYSVLCGAAPALIGRVSRDKSPGCQRPDARRQPCTQNCHFTVSYPDMQVLRLCKETSAGTAEHVNPCTTNTFHTYHINISTICLTSHSRWWRNSREGQFLTRRLDIMMRSSPSEKMTI